MRVRNIMRALLLFLLSATMAVAQPAPPPYRAPVGITDIGSATQQPFVIICAGQSNAAGADTGGSKALDQSGAGILMTNSFTNPTALVTAAFGAAPLNVGGAPYNNNQCVQSASYLRTSGMIPAGRPIVVVFSISPGQSISDWVDGTPTDVWAIQAQALALVTAAYPSGWKINHIIWDQGESDTSQQVFTASIAATTMTVSLVTTGSIRAGQVVNGPGVATGTVTLAQLTGPSGGAGTYSVSVSQTVASEGMTIGSVYGSESLYAGAFTRLVAAYQALPQWSNQLSRISATELGTWFDNGSADRNDFFRTVANGGAYPSVTLVTSTGLVESTQSPGPHFDGASLVILGTRHFAAWAAAAPNNTYAGQTPYYGLGVHNFSLQGSLVGGQYTGIGVDDIRYSAVLNATGGTFKLPDPMNSNGPIIVTCNNSSTFLAYGSHSGTSFILQNLGFTTYQGSYVCGIGTTALFIPENTYWNVIQLSHWVGDYLDYTTNAVIAANPALGYGSGLMGSFISTLGGGTISFTPRAGQRQGWSVDSTATSATTITSTVSSGLVAPDGTLVTNYPVYPGNTIVIEGGFTASNVPQAKILSDVFRSGRTSSKTIPVTGATDTAVLAGFGSQLRSVIPAGALAALTEPLPATPFGGQQIAYYFSQAITALSFTGGTVSTWTNGSAVTAQQKITLQYSADDSVWQ